MQSIPLLDRAGRRRSPATTATFHQGASPGNKGLRYPPDPPTVEEIIAVLRAAGNAPEGVRLRGVIVVLWRAGLRISEALALNETDLDPGRGALLVRHGKGDKRREVGMDRWGWSHLRHGSSCAPVCRSGGCSASSADRRGAGRALRRESAAVARRRDRGWRSSTVCAASAATRACSRDVTRRDVADRDPAPTRPRRPGDHLEIPARYRHHRDHPSRPSAARTDDPRREATPTRALIVDCLLRRRMWGREPARPHPRPRPVGPGGDDSPQVHTARSRQSDRGLEASAAADAIVPDRPESRSKTRRGCDTRRRS